MNRHPLLSFPLSLVRQVSLASLARQVSLASLALPMTFALLLTSCEPPRSSDEASLLVSTTEGLRGEVRYAGKARGALKVAAFTSFPPRGPPAAQVRIEAPSFPQPYALEGLPQGRYFVLAVLDVDAGDGDRFRPTRDPGGALGSFTAPQTVTVDGMHPSEGLHIQLVDPSDASPWIRAGYR